VEQGEIISLIGSNGAGKTTTLHSVSNLLKKNGGTIFFQGEDITNLAADKIVRRGLVQVPEGRRVFANMSVRENLEMGAFTRTDGEKIREDMEWCFELFPRLKERLNQISGTLSGGEQQMLAMARALMAKPKLLLLDEPSMGLAPILVDEIFSIVQKISSSGATILLVEQNAYKALSIADRAYILETGLISKSGCASDLISDGAVKSAYLGA
jgi:branched-chain amino acid transport system ATP-binding protein